MHRILLTLCLALAPHIASAQAFTTSAEVRPILEATRANWVALREYDGRDLLYFTHLEAWRCGIREIRFGVNTLTADLIWGVEPCYRDTASPNALTDDSRVPYMPMPLDSAQTVTVELVFDDGSTISQDYTRKAILLP